VSGSSRATRERLAGCFRDALGLWRGPPLAEFRYEAFARDEIARLEELRLVALEQRLEADLALGRHAETVPELEALVREHPLRENLRRLLMLALYRSGRQADALSAYQDARAALVDELGLDPSESLHELETAILRHDPALDLASQPPAARATNLPVAATALVGREHELGQLDTLLGEGVRLLTLTGPGGAGKTRLALAAASGLAGRFRSGVFWVGLAPLRDPELVVPAISQVVGARTGLAEHIGERELLLVLDNLEQVIDAGPELAGLVETCPNLCLLVSSRERLAVRAETELEVPPLPDDDALSLFAARSRLEPTAAAEELCRRLDNMPLALELAAARTKTLAPERILERLGGRLDLLSGGRDADPRQRSLRATIEWSYDLLDPEEQRLFARLAIFVGGCTLEAAEQVCDADIDTLGALVEKSLVRHGLGRYRMLETIRDYALERLDESGERELLARRHAAWMLDLAERYDTVLFSARDDEEVDVVDAEHENGRAALEYLLETDPDTALRLAAALAVVWSQRGRHADGSLVLETAIAAAPDAPPAIRAKALYRAAHLHPTPGVGDEASYEAALELFEVAGDPVGALVAGTELAYVSLYQGDLDGAADLAAALVEKAQVLADPLTLSYASGLAAQVLEERDELRAGRELHLEAIRLARQAGHQVPIRAALFALGWNELHGQDYQRARETCLDLLAHTSPHDKVWWSMTLQNLGWAELFLGELAAAQSHLDEALGHIRAVRDKRGVAEAAFAVAALRAARGSTSRAAMVWGAGRGLLAASDQQPTALERRAEERWLEPLRDEHRADYELGTTLDLDETIELALRPD
jgi:predicted ATPase